MQRASRRKKREGLPLPRGTGNPPRHGNRARAGASARRVALHFKASAAPRNMGDDRLAAMDLRDGAEVDGEGQLDDRALGEAEVAGLDEHAVGGKVVRLAERAATARDHDIDGGARPVAAVQTSFHIPRISAFLLGAAAASQQYADAREG